MDINTQRYFDSIGVSGYNKKTFLNKWHKWGTNKFFEIYRKEADDYHELSSAYYKNQIEKGIHGMDVVASEGYKNIEKNFNPIKRHKVMWFLSQLPFRIECWLCCGWKLKYVPSDGIRKGYWTWIDRYHMLSKLCRYGEPMWPEYRFTWWDKLRFKWITGYKYEEVK